MRLNEIFIERVKAIEDAVGANMIIPEDKSSFILNYLKLIDDPNGDLRAANLASIRLLLDHAVLLKKYDRIDAETIGGRVVTVDYVVGDGGHEISGLESFIRPSRPVNTSKRPRWICLLRGLGLT